MAQGKSFFDDVTKELECSVCQELFSEDNEPKLLKCLHTFCKNCLEAWLRQQREGQISCPTCRQITECPNNNISILPSNLFYKQMVEIVDAYSGTSQEADSLLCGSCGEKKPLKFYCFDCNTFLCEECTSAHKKGKLFRGHHVKEIGKFESSDVQDYARKANVCKKHKDEFRFYCENCTFCICRDCAILEHRDHKINSMEQGLENKKSDIKRKMQDVEAIACRIRSQRKRLEKRSEKVLGSINQATSEVHRVAEHRISLIRQHESAMTKALLEQKQSFQGAFSVQISSMDEKLMEIDSSLTFGNEVLDRENLPEILNVEEILDQRFQKLSSEFCVNLAYSCVKYIPNEASSLNDEPGELIFTKSDPRLSTANGKGLTEGIEGEDCSFKIETKDSQGQRSYSGFEKVDVDIRSLEARNIISSEITDCKNGSYEVKYKPEVAGKYQVTITVEDDAIMDSPFQLEVREKLRQSKDKEIGGIIIETASSVKNSGSLLDRQASRLKQQGRCFRTQHLNQVLSSDPNSLEVQPQLMQLLKLVFKKKLQDIEETFSVEIDWVENTSQVWIRRSKVPNCPVRLQEGCEAFINLYQEFHPNMGREEVELPDRIDESLVNDVVSYAAEANSAVIIEKAHKNLVVYAEKSGIRRCVQFLKENLGLTSERSIKRNRRGRGNKTQDASVHNKTSTQGRYFPAQYF